MKDQKQTLAIALALLFLVFIVIGYAVYKNTQNVSPLSWKEREEKINTLENELHQISRNIKTFHGEGNCRLDQDCRIVGLGVKSCDEYKNFLVYSVLDSEEKKLLELVGLFNQKSQEMSTLNLSIPACGKKPAQVKCIRKKCIAVEGSS